jgi:hypothetical protein
MGTGEEMYTGPEVTALQGEAVSVVHAPGVSVLEKHEVPFRHVARFQ